jgi:hypothetical protein
MPKWRRKRGVREGRIRMVGVCPFLTVFVFSLEYKLVREK